MRNSDLFDDARYARVIRSKDLSAEGYTEDNRLGVTTTLPRHRCYGFNREIRLKFKPSPAILRVSRALGSLSIKSSRNCARSIRKSQTRDRAGISLLDRSISKARSPATYWKSASKPSNSQYLHATNSFNPGRGFLPEDFPYARTKVIPLDEGKMIARFAPGIEIPLKPFFGSMGIAPPDVSGRISSGPPWVHAGNLDNRELVAGTTL